MNTRLLVCLGLLFAAVFTSCSSTSSKPSEPAVKLGMTRQQVREAYGAPVRVEKHRDGGESWHYNLQYTAKDGHPVTTSSSAIYEPYKRTPQTTESSVSIGWGGVDHQHQASVDFNSKGLVNAVPRGAPVKQP